MWVSFDVDGLGISKTLCQVFMCCSSASIEEWRW